MWTASFIQKQKPYKIYKRTGNHVPGPFVYILDLRILASQNFLDKLDDFEFKRVRIITESSHFSDDEAVEVLLEAQNSIRTIENSHNA